MSTPEPWRPSTPTAASSPGPAEERGNWFTRGGWWFFVHLLSLGFLSPVPYIYAAALTRRIAHAVLAVVVVAVVVAGVSLIGSGPKGPDGRATGAANDIGGTLLFLNLVGGLGGLIVVRQQTYGARARAARTASVPQPVDPAVASALAARERRAEARRLATDDPLLAREIRIGRPDLPRTYDDGGLVDLNSAPAGAVAEVCGLDHDVAERVVAARQAVGRFGSVEDVFAYADVPVEVWDVLRDRGVVVG